MQWRHACMRTFQALLSLRSCSFKLAVSRTSAPTPRAGSTAPISPSTFENRSSSRSKSCRSGAPKGPLEVPDKDFRCCVRRNIIFAAAVQTMQLDTMRLCSSCEQDVSTTLLYALNNTTCGSLWQYTPLQSSGSETLYNNSN
eukprot:1322-Heterococcus_DN1.PRE.3